MIALDILHRLSTHTLVKKRLCITADILILVSMTIVCNPFALVTHIHELCCSGETLVQITEISQIYVCGTEYVYA